MERTSIEKPATTDRSTERLPWDVLVGRFREELFRFLLRIAGQDAEDLCHDSFLRAVQAAPFGLPSHEARPLLYRIAKNPAIDRSRQQRRRPTVRLAEVRENPLGSTLPPEGSRDLDQLFAQIETFITTLPDRQRLALVLRVFQDLSYEEITQVMGGNQAAARANVCQAIKKIRKRFSAAWEEIR